MPHSVTRDSATVALLTLVTLTSPLQSWAETDCGDAPDKPAHHLIPANSETVHWGYFSKQRAPQAKVHSGDLVTLETLTHHANDDASRMVQGDPGAESVFSWAANSKGVDRRGAGPMDASAYGRGVGVFG